MKLSQRAQRIEPFYVMEMGKTAALLAQQFAHTDRPMIALNIGEPDFTAPPLVQAAAHQAIQDGQTQYTHALGLQALRERISQWYASRFAAQVPASRIVITAGASAAGATGASGGADVALCGAALPRRCGTCWASGCSWQGGTCARPRSSRRDVWRSPCSAPRWRRGAPR